MIPKIIAMYLPQFHQIPENDEFWGKGFTDWVTVKNAKPLFEGHQQPRVPLNDNYYDLSIKENVEWQCKLAKEYGVYGFGIYHYWFNNDKNLLTKPAEIMRDSKNINTKYFFVWDNCLWKRSWSNISGNDWAPIEDKKECVNKKQNVLIPYILGNEPDWRNHYEYLKQHFASNNYEKLGNKPVFSIIHYNKEILEMCDYWDQLAKADGYDGIYFIFKRDPLRLPPRKYVTYNYEPHNSGWDYSYIRIWNKILRLCHIQKRLKMTFYEYEKVWSKILQNAAKNVNRNIIPGAFVNYDDSPRRGKFNSKIILGASPEKFKINFQKLLILAKSQGKDYVFLTAWNEWGEGAFLEPDQINKFEYLTAIKESFCAINK